MAYRWRRYLFYAVSIQLEWDLEAALACSFESHHGLATIFSPILRNDGEHCCSEIQSCIYLTDFWSLKVIFFSNASTYFVAFILPSLMFVISMACDVTYSQTAILAECFTVDKMN